MFLSISSLQTDDLNMDRSSCSVRNFEAANNVQTKCTFCGGTNHSAENCLKKSDRKRKNLCGWSFGQHMNGTDASKIL